MGLHAGLNPVHAGVQFSMHHFGGQGAEKISQFGEEQVPVLVHFQDFQEDAVVDRYLTHSFCLQVAVDRIKGGVEQAVIQIVDQAFPFSARHPVNHSVADIAVPEIHFHGQPVQEAVDVDLLLQVCQVFRIVCRIAFFDFFAQAGIFVSGIL